MPYFDLQVNGCYGVDFNGDDWTIPQLLEAVERLRASGVTGILATVITDELPRMCRRLERLVEARVAHPEIAHMLVGFHIEGPFLNETPGYIGAHPVHAARLADLDSMEKLLRSAAGLTRIVTLAPERDPDWQVTRYLADQSIIVAAGHCNPTLDQLDAAIEAGVSMFTHLGNGCPLEQHRHDNIVQRVLSRAHRLWIGFIADGVHLPYFALKNYLRCAGIERCFVVTDAISAAGLGPGSYQLGDQTVVVDEQLATWSADRSHLTGSASTMERLAANLRLRVGLSEADVARLTYSNPRAIIHDVGHEA